MEILKQYFRKISPIPEEELNGFCQLFEEKQVKKKAMLLLQGEICTQEVFVVEGLLRLFHTNALGEEQTLQFGVEHWWFADLHSLFNQTPSRLSIQALEDSRILTLSYENRKAAEAKYPFLNNLTKIMFQKGYTALQNRLIDALSKTAEERYLDYLKRYPHIVKRLSNIHIASYLGISPESLSRIKSEMSRKRI